ncbi:energy-coupled thiamine transporter ThiT [Desulfovibrio sp.]|uniref:energy-coupled thiamine transporter ThiT n=1 Tax=Desulfovibrio sp. TaxID=885 RepID=UPI0025C1E92E|nr:energy-coupled thiamine transporter ThiT [Desulfovibrio sp.]
MTTLSEIFGKFAEIPAGTWIALVLIVAFGVALAVVAPKVKWNAKMLAAAALCIAMSFVLSYVRLLHMPQGGSITPASMLPVMMFAFAYGFGPGLLCCLAYGVLQMFQDMYIVGWVQAALDYLIAFGGLSIVALFRGWKSPLNFSVGVVAAGALRVICHVISGVVYFAEYAPEGMDPLVYSLTYNLTSVGVDALICAVLGFVPLVRNLARRMGPQGVKA